MIGLAERPDLAAEAAAALHRDDPDPVLGDAEHVGRLRARVEGALRARPEGEEPGGVPLGQHGVGLEVPLVDHRHAVGLLEHQVGLGEALRHVAPLEPRLLGDVGRLRRPGLGRGDGHARVGERLAPVGLGPQLGDRRGARLHRRDRVDRRREHLVLDLDQVERLLGDRQLVGGDRRHRLAREDDAIDRQHRVGPGGRLVLQLRDVRRDQDRPHAGQRPGPARVDLEDAGVGVGAAQELRVEQAARLEVGHVLDLAGDLLGAVRARDGEPDPADLARRLHRRHGLSSSPSPAPSRRPPR